MKKKTVKILMGVALISTLLGACSTNRSTQNEQKTLNTEISKIVKNHSESTYEENTKQIFMTQEIHHAKRMLYGFVRIWSIHHNIMH